MEVMPLVRWGSDEWSLTTCCARGGPVLVALPATNVDGAAPIVAVLFDQQPH